MSQNIMACYFLKNTFSKHILCTRISVKQSLVVSGAKNFQAGHKHRGCQTVAREPHATLAGCSSCGEISCCCCNACKLKIFIIIIFLFGEHLTEWGSPNYGSVVLYGWRVQFDSWLYSGHLLK